MNIWICGCGIGSSEKEVETKQKIIIYTKIAGLNQWFREEAYCGKFYLIRYVLGWGMEVLRIYQPSKSANKRPVICSNISQYNFGGRAHNGYYNLHKSSNKICLDAKFYLSMHMYANHKTARL